MNYPSKAIADLMKWASRHGCIYRGIAASGHAKIELPNGEVYTTSASPADTNTRKAKHDLARMLGVKLERPAAGRYRHQPTGGRHVPAEVRVDSVSAKYARLEARHRTLCDEIRDAKSSGYPARGALDEIATVEADIVKLGRRPPLRSFRS
ncbi:hypothetical protein [Microbacterium sp. NPDC089696]|uniref:hypothetical protein n=1 Tax=Microbacterium sp. NPDC089696 TaxID=3364199 RepID=UPI00382DBAF5